MNIRYSNTYSFTVGTAGTVTNTINLNNFTGDSNGTIVDYLFIKITSSDSTTKLLTLNTNYFSSYIDIYGQSVPVSLDGSNYVGYFSMDKTKQFIIPSGAPSFTTTYLNIVTSNMAVGDTITVFLNCLSIPGTGTANANPLCNNFKATWGTIIGVGSADVLDGALLSQGVYRIKSLFVKSESVSVHCIIDVALRYTGSAGGALISLCPFDILTTYGVSSTYLTNNNLCLWGNTSSLNVTNSDVGTCTYYCSYMIDPSEK